jgi:FkbM family methyltransferase
MISQNYFTFPLYLPRICRLWSNWPEYLCDYLLRRNSRFRKTTAAVYRMRNGVQLMDSSGTLAGTMAVVFVRREYGRFERLRTIVDIGANIGSFAVYAAQFCPEAKIYCYEPEPRNFGSLKQNIEINGLAGRVVAFQCAVASNNGRRDLAVTEGSLTNSFHIVPSDAGRATVNCTTLPDIFASQKLDAIDLLKMNCEGTEYEILESCSGADLDRIANIRLEYHNLDAQKKTGESLSKFLQARGYRIERFTRYLKASGFIWAARTWIGSELIVSLPELIMAAA